MSPATTPWAWYRDPAVLSSRFGTRYVGDMDRLFDTYSLLLSKVTDHVRETIQQTLYRLLAKRRNVFLG